MGQFEETVRKSFAAMREFREAINLKVEALDEAVDTIVRRLAKLTEGSSAMEEQIKLLKDRVAELEKKAAEKVKEDVSIKVSSEDKKRTPTKTAEDALVKNEVRKGKSVITLKLGTPSKKHEVVHYEEYDGEATHFAEYGAETVASADTSDSDLLEWGA